MQSLFFKEVSFESQVCQKRAVSQAVLLPIYNRLNTDCVCWFIFVFGFREPKIAFSCKNFNSAAIVLLFQKLQLIPNHHYLLGN